MTKFRNRWLTALLTTLGVAALVYIAAPPLLSVLGGRQLSQRNHTSALAWLETAHFLQPGDPTINYQLACVHRRIGEKEEAKIHLDQAYADGLSKQLYDREQQIAQLQEGRYPSSIEQWRTLIQDAGSDLPEICEAFVLFRISRFETQQALQLLDAWRDQYPQDARCRQLTGNVYMLMEKWQPAIEMFQAASELTDNNAAILVDLAEAQSTLLQYEQAAASLVSALSQGTERQAEAVVLLANCYANLDRQEEARQLLYDHLDDGEASPALLGQLAKVEFDLGELEVAHTHIAEAIAIDPANLQNRYLSARILAAQGKASAADQEFEFVRRATDASVEIPVLTSELVHRPNDLQLRFRLAKLCWLYQGQEVGMRWFQELLQRAPQHQQTHRLLAEHFAAVGDEKRAAYHRSHLQNP